VVLWVSVDRQRSLVTLGSCLRRSTAYENGAGGVPPTPLWLDQGSVDHMWIGLPCTAMAASLIASEWVGCAWQV
jgi:hypothetical protein